MIVSIHQPNYLPWMGLIHKILNSNIFVILDDVQLVRGKSFVIRTQIKTTGGPKWLTIPVNNKNDFLPINQIKINNEISWKNEHWNKIVQNYNKTRFFEDFEEKLREIVFQKWEKISDMNIAFIKQILEILEIDTKIIRSSELGVTEKGVKKIIGLVKAAEGDEYLSGQGKGSVRYVHGNEKEFQENNIQLKFQNFLHPTYTQLHGNFVPNLSVWDSIFNIGPEDTLKKITQDK